MIITIIAINVLIIISTVKFITQKIYYISSKITTFVRCLRLSDIIQGYCFLTLKITYRTDRLIITFTVTLHVLFSKRVHGFKVVVLINYCFLSHFELNNSVSS